MKILSIGNSFSINAMKYLHQIAKADGVNIKAVALYIGSCSLATHYKNMNNDAIAYEIVYNGENTKLKTSIREALQSEEWDVVTVQQASWHSVDYDTYQPYLDALVKYIKFHSPKSKIMVHKTWAYRQGCDYLKKLGYSDQIEMHNALSKAYEKANMDLGGVEMLVSGDVMQALLKAGISDVHSDDIHANALGEYAMGLVWYKKLTGNSPLGNSFRDFCHEAFDDEVKSKNINEVMTEENIKIAQKCADEVVE